MNSFSKKEKKTVKSIVIGGGFGGIAIALRLRALGHNVTLLEKLDALEEELRFLTKMVLNTMLVQLL